jgi:hypothetical protein
MRDTKQKHSISGVRPISWYFIEATLRVSRFRNRLRFPQHFAVIRFIPPVGPGEVTALTPIVIAAWNVAAFTAQAHIMVAVVTGTSEPVCDAVLFLVRGKFTQLGES